jgi:hypothetical protein
MSVKTEKMTNLLKEKEKIEGDMEALVEFLDQTGVGVNGSKREIRFDNFYLNNFTLN